MIDYNNSTQAYVYQLNSSSTDSCNNYLNENYSHLINKSEITSIDNINALICNQLITFKGELIKLIFSKLSSDSYLINLNKFNISNNNTNAIETTAGINKALKFAKEQGYEKVSLPPGDYLIETDTIHQEKTFIDINDSTKTWTTNLKGIIIPDNIEFNIEECTLNLKPNSSPQQSVITFANSDNSKLIGGTIIGDRDTHLFDLIINMNNNELESGAFDDKTGLPITDSTQMRTKDYIATLYNGNSLPSEFVICPLSNTSTNTVDGGSRYIYCYDINDTYLGKANGNNSFLTRASLPTGTAKIKISFKNETRSDAKYYLSTEKVYPTFEQGFGIKIYNSNNVTINGSIIKSFLTDGIITMPMNTAHSNNNLKILNCTLEDNRRQGISLVGSSNSTVIQGCSISKTQGVDPQCGIDIEHYSYVKNVLIDTCNFYDNKKWDIINYNGTDIEITNCNFNGGIGSTHGYNMNIHNNYFEYYNNPTIQKYHTAALALNIPKNIASNPYFKIYNNTFKDYSNVSSSTLSNSTFYKNKLYNCTTTPASNASYNKYFNCSVYMLNGVNYNYEYYDNCIITGGNRDGLPTSGICSNLEINNSEFTGSAIIKNSKITMIDRSFITKWGFLYTFDNCTINTKYTTNIPFISSQGCDSSLFTNCTMNLSCTPFIAANYKKISINNCTITFNESYNSNETILFYKNVYGSATFSNNNFYKRFDYPKITLPSSTNSTINDIKFSSGTY